MSAEDDFLTRIRDTFSGRGLYTLDANLNPVPVGAGDEALLAWGQWFETADRQLCQDMDEGEGAFKVRVSTVFLGMDMNHWGVGPPLLWETMVFGGPLNLEQHRYSTIQEAVEGHQVVCIRVREAMTVLNELERSSDGEKLSDARLRVDGPGEAEGDCEQGGQGRAPTRRKRS